MDCLGVRQNEFAHLGCADLQRLDEALTKSDLLQCLESLNEVHLDAPVTTCIVIHGAAIVHMLKPGAANTFDEYSSQILIPYLATKLKQVTRLDLVWDTYKQDSLKGMEIRKRGQGVRRRVLAETAIPGNWPSFLCVDCNKTDLYRFLSEAAFQWFDIEGKQLFITDGERVLSKPPLYDLASLAPCNHEEADSRMLLHVSHVTHHGHRKIMLRTVDTDVVVLAVSVVQELQPRDELWVAFGTGKGFRYLAAH